MPSWCNNYFKPLASKGCCIFISPHPQFQIRYPNSSVVWLSISSFLSHHSRFDWKSPIHFDFQFIKFLYFIHIWSIPAVIYDSKADELKSTSKHISAQMLFISCATVRKKKQLFIPTYMMVLYTTLDIFNELPPFVFEIYIMGWIFSHNGR